MHVKPTEFFIPGLVFSLAYACDEKMLINQHTLLNGRGDIMKLWLPPCKSLVENGGVFYYAYNSL